MKRFKLYIEKWLNGEQVKARYENFLTGEIEMIPAIIVKM